MIVSIDEPDPNKYFGGDVSAPVVGQTISIYDEVKILMKNPFLTLSSNENLVTNSKYLKKMIFFYLLEVEQNI